MIKTRSRNRAAVSIGVAISAFFFWLALRDVDGASLLDAFKSINLIPIVFSATALTTGNILRAVRWRVISGFLLSEQLNFFRAANLGVLVNLIFPGRAGEFVRIITLAKLCNSTLARPLASALIDRLVDAFVLLISASIFIVVLPIDFFIGGWLLIAWLSGIAIVICVLVFSRSSFAIDAVIRKLSKRWLQRFPLMPTVFLRELRDEFRRLTLSWISIELVGLSLLILSADYASLSALLLSFDLTLPIEAPLLLWVFLALGSALPSAPGYVGVYQIATIWALSFYSVPPPVSVAISTVLQLLALAVALSMVGLGGIKYMHGHRSKESG